MRRLVLALIAGLIAFVGLAGCGIHQQHDHATPVRYHSYVALGDTFLAAPYTSKTGKPPCLRASHAYPRRVAHMLKIPKVADAGCNLADATAVAKKQVIGSKKRPPQLSRVDKHTDLVTMQFGSNENQLYQDFVTACSGRGKCQLAKNVSFLLAYAALARQDLDNAVRAVQKRTPHATILVVGYPRVVTTHSHCKALPHLKKADLKAWVQVDSALNQAISRAARDTAATYVDVYGPSKGHDVCSATPWVRGDRTSKSRGVAYGPTAAEQAAVARLIVSAARNPTS